MAETRVMGPADHAPPLVVSVNVGLPRDFGRPGAMDPLERPWRSASIKDPVEGPVWLGRAGLTGDAQADRRMHGGEDMTALAYAADHYPYWRRELDRPDFAYGAFGENLTIAGMREESVCIGDTLAVGEARVQVTMPRGPCINLARRWKVPDMIERVRDAGWAGWYLRVLQEGHVRRGDPAVVLERPHPEWTVMRAARVRQHRHEDRESARALAACPELSDLWRRPLISDG